MILSFAILGLLYIVFLSVLAYIGLGFLPITIIAFIMILAQWYFSDKIVLWSSGAKVVTRDQFPELHNLVERIVARNSLPKPKIAIINTRMPNAFATGKGPKSSVVAVTLLTWVVSFLIIRAISRYREFAADRGSAQMTGKPVELANALMKISGNMKNIPTRDLRQEEGLNAFFIIPALSGSTIGNLFSTHPPVQKRVQKLMEMEASMG